MERNVGGWFEIYVNDLDRAQAFYESVLEMKLMDMPMPEGSGDMQMKAFPMPQDMNASGAPGALVKMTDMPGGGSGTIVYFNSTDCETELSRVEAAGGAILQPKLDIGEYGFAAMVQDTEGNVIGFHSNQ